MARFDGRFTGLEKSCFSRTFSRQPMRSAARESVRRLKDKGVRLWLSTMAKG